MNVLRIKTPVMNTIQSRPLRYGDIEEMYRGKLPRDVAPPPSRNAPVKVPSQPPSAYSNLQFARTIVEPRGVARMTPAHRRRMLRAQKGEKEEEGEAARSTGGGGGGGSGNGGPPTTPPFDPFANVDPSAKGEKRPQGKSDGEGRKKPKTEPSSPPTSSSATSTPLDSNTPTPSPAPTPTPPPTPTPSPEASPPQTPPSASARDQYLESLRAWWAGEKTLEQHRQDTANLFGNWYDAGSQPEAPPHTSPPQVPSRTPPQTPLRGGTPPQTPPEYPPPNWGTTMPPPMDPYADFFRKTTENFRDYLANKKTAEQFQTDNERFRRELDEEIGRMRAGRPHGYYGHGFPYPGFPTPIDAQHPLGPFQPSAGYTPPPPPPTPDVVDVPFPDFPEFVHPSPPSTEPPKPKPRPVATEPPKPKPRPAATEPPKPKPCPAATEPPKPKPRPPKLNPQSEAEASPKVERPSEPSEGVKHSPGMEASIPREEGKKQKIKISDAEYMGYESVFRNSTPQARREYLNALPAGHPARNLFAQWTEREREEMRGVWVALGTTAARGTFLAQAAEPTRSIAMRLFPSFDREARENESTGSGRKKPRKNKHKLEVGDLDEEEKTGKGPKKSKKD